MSARTDLDLEIDGLQLEAMELRGAAPALVLLHEGLGSVSAWRDFPEALHRATSRRVIAFSRFGHGSSDAPLEPRTPSFFREEALDVLPEVLRRLAVEEPVLVGHSDGASIALIYAGAHPVRGLVLLAPHVLVEEMTLAAIRETRERFETGDLRERLARHHRDPDVAFRNWCDVWLDPTLASWTLEPDAERVTSRVLLIQGGEDPYGSLDQLDRIGARVRGPVRTLVVPGGHSPHRDAPDQVLREIARLVQEVDDSR